MDSLKEIEFNNKVDKRIREVVPKMLQSSAFPQRKLTDTPSDDLQVVNRRYVTLNGTTIGRPNSPVNGQSFFDTTLGFPIWYYNGAWVNSSGTPQ